MSAIVILLSIIMNKSKSNKKRSSQPNGRKRGAPKATSSSLLTNHHIGGVAGRIRVPEDFSRKPASFILSQTPPKNIRDQIHWFQDTLLNTTLTISNTSLTEYNQSFSLSGLSNVSAYTNLYDQYCIHSVLVSFAITSSADYFSGTQGRVTTALDFDNISSLGSEATLQQYSSAITNEVTPGLSIERYVKPTVKGYISAGSGAYAGVPERVWLDCTLPTIGHFGVRSIWAGNSESSLTVDITNVMIIGMRNSL
jgi:hypothetical protein